MRTLLTLSIILTTGFVFGNHQPVAQDDAVTAFVGRWVAIDVLANDYDRDGDDLELRIVASSLPPEGEAMVTEDKLIVFRLLSGPAVPLSFDYEVDDGRATARASVFVDLLPLGPHARVFSQEYQYRQPILSGQIFDNLPDTSVNQRISRLFVLRNDGPETMTFQSGINVTSPGGAFWLNPGDAPVPGSEMPPYDERTFRIFFKPSSLGPHTAQVQIDVDDPSGPFTFEILGHSVTPQQLAGIRVEQNGVLIPNGGTFDSRGGPSYSFDIINTGTQSLALGVFEAPFGYELTGVPVEPVSPGGADMLDMDLIAPDFPTVAGVLEFETNVPDHETFRIFENHRPSVNDDARAINTNESVFINLTANDEDPDGDEVRLGTGQDLFPSLSLVGSTYSSPVGGEIIRIDDRIIRYTPPLGFGGQDDFVYQAHDGRGRHDLGRVVIDVGSGSTAPTTLELIAQDSFSNPAGNLQGLPVAYHRDGTATWTGSAEVGVTEERVLTASDLSGNTHIKAYFPYRPFQYGGTTIELRAKLRLRQTKWVALALTHGSGGVFGSNADLVFLLRPDGRGTLLASHLHQLANCDPLVSGYSVDPDDFVSARMRFDQQGGTVSVWIGDRRVIDRVPYQDPNNSLPLTETVTNAGLYMVTSTSNTQGEAFAVDDIELRQGEVRQPEMVVHHGERVLLDGDLIPVHVERGNSGQAVFEISNSGNEPLLIDNLALTGPSQWTLVSPATTQMTVPPGVSQQIELGLDGTATGSFPAVLSFTTNDIAQPQMSLSLDGQVTVPHITLIECRRDSVQGPLVAPGETLVYQDSYLGHLGAFAKLVIDNVSDQTLQLTITHTGSQWQRISPANVTLVPGARTFVEFRADTSSLGTKQTTVTIQSDVPAPAFDYTLVSEVQAEPDRPVIVFQTRSQLVWQGNPATFEARVEGGTPPYVYTWHVDNNCCGLQACSVESCAYPGVTGFDTNQLVFASVDPSHVGGYNLFVEDANGQTTSSDRSFLNLYQLALRDELYDQVGDGSNNHTFHVSVDADPNRVLSYAWTLSEQPIALDDPRFAGADSGDLVLINPSAQHDGLYSCTISDGSDSVTSSASFTFVEPMGQVVDTFDAGLPDWIQAELDGRQTSYGDRIWTATPGLHYDDGRVRLADYLGYREGSAQIPFTVDPSQITSIRLIPEPGAVPTGSKVTLAILDEPQVPWAANPPLEVTYHKVATDVLEITARSREGATTSHTISGPVPAIWTLDYNPMQSVTRVSLNGFSHAFTQPLDTAYVGFKLEHPTNSPRLIRFEAHHHELLVAHDDTYSLVLQGGETTLLEPTENDVGPVQSMTVQKPVHGVAELDDDHRVLYRAPLGFVGEDRFNYQVRNPYGSTSSATVTVTVRDSEDREIAIPEGYFHVRQGEVIGIDAGALAWTLDGEAPQVISAGYPNQGVKGFATLQPDGTIAYHADPQATGFDTFSFEMAHGGQHTGTAHTIVRESSAGHYWETFQRPVLGFTVPIHREPIVSGNNWWIAESFPLDLHTHSAPLTIGAGALEFGYSENMHALLPVDGTAGAETLIVAEIDLSDAAMTDTLMIGLVEKSSEFFGITEGNQGIRLSLKRGGFISGTPAASLNIGLNYSFEASLLDDPVELRLHLHPDRHVDVYLNWTRVLQTEIPPIDFSKLNWAGVALKSEGGQTVPKVLRFEVFEQSSFGVPDPILHDDFEGDLARWTRTVGTVAIQQGDGLFGDGLLSVATQGQPSYGEFSLPLPRSEVHSRVYADLSDLDMAIGDSFVLWMLVSETNEVVGRVEIRNTSAGLQAGIRARSDAQTPWSTGNWVDLPLEVSLIETAYDANGMTMTVDRGETSIAAMAALPPVALIRLGAVSGVDATTAGTLRFDGLAANEFSDSHHRLTFFEPFRDESLEGWQQVNGERLDVARPWALGPYPDKGLRVIHDGTNPVTITRALPQTEAEVSGSFFFHPNSLSMTGNAHEIFQAYDPQFDGVVRLVLTQTGTGEYAVQVRVRANDGTWVSGGYHTISNEFHQMGWVKQTRNAASFSFAIDGEVVDTLAVDTSDREVMLVRFGAVSSLDASTSGAVRFDEIVFSKYFIPTQD